MLFSIGSPGTRRSFSPGPRQRAHGFPLWSDLIIETLAPPRAKADEAERPQGAARPWPAAAPATLAPPLRARAADSRSESRGAAHRKPLIGSIFVGALINIKGNGPLFQASRSFVKPSKMHPNLVRFKALLVHCSIVAENIALMDACEAMACSAFYALL